MFKKTISVVLTVVVISSLLLSAVELLVLQSFSQFMEGTGALYTRYMQQWPFLLIGGILFRFGLGLTVTGIQSFAVFTVQKQIYTEIMARMKPTNICKSDKNETSEIARKILLDVSNFTNGVLLSVANIITEAIVILAYCAFFMTLSALDYLNYLLILGPLLAILIIAFLIISNKLQTLGVIRQEYEKKRFFYPYVLTNSYIDVHSLKVFNEITAEAVQNENNYRRLQTIASILQNAPRFTVEAILLSSLILITIYFTRPSNISIDPLVMLFVIVRLLPAFSKILSNFNSIKYYWSSANTIFEMIEDNLSTIEDDTGYTVWQKEELKSIHINGITFKINGIKKIVCADIKYGMINLISGKSGSGKTTFLKILCGLQKPLSGEILFPNNETQDNMAYIPQSIEVMEGSVRENINFFRTERDDESFNQALEISGLAKVLSERSITLETQITEDGRNLSGGQAQRLSIARGLSHAPNAIIMDEALSGIHRSDAREILQNLMQQPEMFIILTTHDPQILDGLPVNEIAI